MSTRARAWPWFRRVPRPFPGPPLEVCELVESILEEAGSRRRPNLEEFLASIECGRVLGPVAPLPHMAKPETLYEHGPGRWGGFPRAYLTDHFMEDKPC